MQYIYVCLVYLLIHVHTVSLVIYYEQMGEAEGARSRDKYRKNTCDALKIYIFFFKDINKLQYWFEDTPNKLQDSRKNHMI